MTDRYVPNATNSHEQDRENQAIARALDQVNQIPVWNKQPERFPFGMIFATSGPPAWDPGGQGAGIYYGGYDGIYKRLLDVADAINTFSFAAYLSIRAPLNTAFPDLGPLWQDLGILTDVGVTPRYISSLGNGRFSFDHEGTYTLLVSGSFEHNSSNSGRITYFRMHNYTDGVDEPGIVSGTGRNAEATPIAVNTIVNIAAVDVGKTFGAQIGNGDAYSAVNFQALGVSIFNVGEWREPLG